MKQFILLVTIISTIVSIFVTSCVIADDGTTLPEPSTILLLGFSIICLGIFLFWKAKWKKKSGFRDKSPDTRSEDQR